MMDVIFNSTTDELLPNSRPLTSHGSQWLNFLYCLGYEQHNLPLGSFLARYHQLDGQWLVATPIRWEASHNNAMIAAAGQDLGLSESESKACFDLVAAYLAEEGLRLFYHDAYTWLVQVDTKPPLTADTPFAMRFQPMMEAMREMDSSLYWLRISTELQMLLTDHPFNGLWFYGAGQFDPASFNNKKIVTDNPLLQAIISSQTRKSSGHTLYLTDSLDQLSNLKQISKHKVRWYWNNNACTTARVGWWNFLWRN